MGMLVWLKSLSRSFYGVVIIRAVADTWHFFGFRPRTPVIAGGVLALGFLIHLAREGWNEVAAEWSVLISFTLVPLGALVLLMLLVNLVYVPVKINRRLTQQVSDLEARWRDERPRLLIRGNRIREHAHPMGRRVEISVRLKNIRGREVRELRIRAGRANENDPTRFLPMVTSQFPTVIPVGESTPIALVPMIIQYQRGADDNLVTPLNEGRYAVYVRLTFWDELDEEFETDAWLVYVPANHPAAKGVVKLADAPRTLIDLVEPHMLAAMGAIESA